MKSGLTTSQEITRAYLDRIAAYDSGPFGFHAFITVADDAMAQAKAADDARAAGNTSELLGIPVAIKDLYDTKDMPTTDGSLAFEGWRPEARRVPGQAPARRRRRDPRQGQPVGVRQLRLLQRLRLRHGLERVQAVQDLARLLRRLRGRDRAEPRRRSAWARRPASRCTRRRPARRWSSLRGTDGISSGAGVMPLTWLQDFEGPIARTTSDIARILNVTTGTDPDDIATVHADADAKRPADWKTALDPNALQGKKIGYVPSAFDASPSYGQDDGTVDALKARFADIVAAGATMVPITARRAERAGDRHAHRQPHRGGLAALLRPHANPPYHTASEILSSPKVLPVQPRDPEPARPRLTRGGHRQDLRPARRVQGALQDVDGHRGRRRGRLPGLPLATSTTTTAPRRSPRTATAACRRPTSACRR